jgi:hypothetical protein
MSINVFVSGVQFFSSASNPPAVLEPPFAHLPAITFLAVDALQMGDQLVAQLVEGAAGFGGIVDGRYRPPSEGFSRPGTGCVRFR